MLGNIIGQENLNKNFLSVCFNQQTEKYDVCYNGYFKNILAKVYDIDPDYDFGAIHPIDVVIDLYIKGLDKDSGVTLRVNK